MKLSELLAESVKTLQGFDENMPTVKKMIANPAKYEKEELAEIADIYFLALCAVRELLSDCVEHADRLEKQIDAHKE